MSEIDSCVRICKNYYRFRKFIAVFSTICEVNFLSTNFAFGHPPEICPSDRENIFTTVFFLVQFLIHRRNPFGNRSKTAGDFAISKQVSHAKFNRFFHIDARLLHTHCDDNGFSRLECTCTGRFWVVFRGHEPLKFVWYSSTTHYALPWVEPRILSHQTSKSVKSFEPCRCARIKKYGWMEEFELAFSRFSGGKWGGVIVTKFCTRVDVGYVIIFANFGVDISRDVDSVRGWSLGFSIYLKVWPYNFSTAVLTWWSTNIIRFMHPQTLVGNARNDASVGEVIKSTGFCTR